MLVSAKLDFFNPVFNDFYVFLLLKVESITLTLWISVWLLVRLGSLFSSERDLAVYLYVL